jgi:uncharacterized OB-fold protein
MTESTLTLEAATVIRVPPPGLDAGYTVAVVRTPEGLRIGRLLCPPDQVPPPGTRVEPVDSPVKDVGAYRPVPA